jgi:hypothetical protein
MRRSSSLAGAGAAVSESLHQLRQAQPAGGPSRAPMEAVRAVDHNTTPRRRAKRGANELPCGRRMGAALGWRTSSVARGAQGRVHAMHATAAAPCTCLPCRRHARAADISGGMAPAAARAWNVEQENAGWALMRMRRRGAQLRFLRAARPCAPLSARTQPREAPESLHAAPASSEREQRRRPRLFGTSQVGVRITSHQAPKQRRGGVWRGEAAKAQPLACRRRPPSSACPARASSLSRGKRLPGGCASPGSGANRRPAGESGQCWRSERTGSSECHFAPGRGRVGVREAADAAGFEAAMLRHGSAEQQSCCTHSCPAAAGPWAFSRQRLRRSLLRRE